MFSSGSHRRGWQLVPQGGAERDAVKVDGPARLRVNNAFGVRDALLHSLGIGQLPLLVAVEGVAAGRLIPVLPAWRPPAVPVHAVYPSNRYLSPNVRAFIDLALARFPSDTTAAAEVTARACAPKARARTAGRARSTD